MLFVLTLTVLLSCDSIDLKQDSQLNPLPSYSIDQDFIQALNGSFMDTWVGNIRCPDNNNPWKSTDEDCVCPLPVINCLEEVVIVIPTAISEYADFIAAVDNDEIDTYFSDSDWDGSFSGSSLLSDLRNGDVIFIGMNNWNANPNSKGWVVVPQGTTTEFYESDIDYVF